MRSPLLLLVLPVLLSLCQQPPMKGTTIKVSTGDTFSIRLQCAAGQGFSWKLIDTTTTNIRTTQKESFETLPNSRPGSDGIQTFHFQAIAPGKETLHFTYIQPFIQPAPKNSPVKVFFILINNH